MTGGTKVKLTFFKLFTSMVPFEIISENVNFSLKEAVQLPPN